MCSYCGCQSITVINLLSRQHEEMIIKVGQVRRAAEKVDVQAAQNYTLELANLLIPHTRLEEEGLFAALVGDDEFVEPVAKLTRDHAEIDELIRGLLAGDISIAHDLDVRLRNHISNEENGIFPASAVSLDGAVWDQIQEQLLLTSSKAQVSQSRTNSWQETSAQL